MATMFPSEVGSFTTAGEKKTYEFLRRVARPDSVFLVWYSPDIEDREPDFILYSPDSGLIVLEVKDWTPGQVLEADPKSALLRIGGHEERRKQPLAQARQYVNSLLSLLGRKAGDKKQIPCPITWGAIFPHMSRAEFVRCGLGKVMDERRVLCWDELSEESPLTRDASGQAFRKWMLERFPPLFPFSLDSGQLDWLRGCIFPVARMEIPQRDPSRQEETILALDHAQENLARSLGLGRLLITGPAGSGKTLILAHQAWHLPRVDKNVKRILITCFNLSLVGYIRRLVAKKGMSLGPDGVEVLPFFDLCEKILGEKLAHASEDGEYYEMIVEECLERLKDEHPLKTKWDAILVDEGQDFSPQMARVILSLLREQAILTVCEDENQRLYQNEDDIWLKADIPGIRHRKINRQYRNTVNIASFATSLLGQVASPPVYDGSRGHEPEWICDSDEQGLIDKGAEQIAALARKKIPLNEIAALYVSSKLDDGRNLPEVLIEALESRGILARWVSRDIISKRTYDITTDSVTISTIHSAKGLDFAHVILFGLDKLRPDRIADRRLAHVGATRARESLALFIRARQGLAAPVITSL